MALEPPDGEREWSQGHEAGAREVGTRIVGIAVVGYLLVLLYTFRLLCRCAPWVGWVRRLDCRWTDLWMR